jgi:hypothetical protein
MAGNTWERMTDVEDLIRSEHPTPRAELEGVHQLHRLSQTTAPPGLG